MGGYGSGRGPRGRHHAMVGDGPALDVRAVQRAGLLAPEACARLSWHDSLGRTIASIICLGLPDGLGIAFSVDGKKVLMTLYLTTTPCHLGGFRHWFTCPGDDCGQRAAILYLHSGVPLCRRCSHLTYDSQFQDQTMRALAKVQRIETRWGIGPARLPLRPTGMHWNKYERLLDGLASARQSYCRSFATWAGRTGDMLDRVHSE